MTLVVARGKMGMLTLMALTCRHVDENALTASQVSKVEQHVIGSDVVDRYSSSLVISHRLWHMEALGFSNVDKLRPHAILAKADDPVSNLMASIK
jgi:hypothetical protein